MDVNSKTNFLSVQQEVIDCEQKLQKATRYVPPGRRGSPTSTSSDEKHDRLWKPSVSPTNQSKVRVNSPNRSQGSVTSSQPRTRTPSPQRKSETVIVDSQPGEEVEIWQGKRKGGNRAPKIEPAGTKSWRDPQKQAESSVHLTPSAHDSMSSKIFVRLCGYSPFILDAIDLHLNVLISCIAPKAQSVSVRNIPRELFPAINSGNLVTEVSSKNYSMGLPGTISMMDFFQLLSTAVGEVKGVGLEHLAYLVDCERVSNSRSRTYNVTKFVDMVASLAVAQLNWEYCRDLTRIPSQDDSPVSFGTRIAILNFREDLLHKETLSVCRQFLQTSADAEIRHLQDLEELGNMNISESYRKMWSSCLRIRWRGLVSDEPPHYPHLLVKAGFAPGLRMPMQLIHAREPSWIYETVHRWMNLEEGMEEIWHPANFHPLNIVGLNV